MRLNKLVLTLRKEGVEQLAAGGRSHSADNNANLPPSVAREGGQDYYQKFFKRIIFVPLLHDKLFMYSCISALLLLIISNDTLCFKNN